MCFSLTFSTQHNAFKIHPCCKIFINTYFLFIAESYSIEWIDYLLFIHSLVAGYLGDNMNIASIDTHVPWFDLGMEFLGHYGNSIFKILRNHQTIFHSDCTFLHFHQDYTKVPIAPVL